MKHITKFFSLSPLVFLISLFITVPVLAFPPLPSSFYGAVSVNAGSVPDGTLVQALIGEAVYAQGYSQTYEGKSVFTLDVPGDDTDTAARDGGRPGDTIQFKVGGVLADQTGTWQGGTNTNLDLTASSAEPLSAPQPTPTPIPTQTAIVVIQQPSPVPPTQAPLQPSPQPTELPTEMAQAAVSQSSPEPAAAEELASAPDQPDQPAGSGTVRLLPSPTSGPAENQAQRPANRLPLVLVAGAVLVGAAVVGYLYRPSRGKK